MGVSWPKVSTFSFVIVAGINGVQIGPGATEFTLMPRSATSCARFLVKFTIAALVVA
jgi:hypothetical protein